VVWAVIIVVLSVVNLMAEVVVAVVWVAEHLGSKKLGQKRKP